MSNMTLDLLDAGFTMKEVSNYCSQEANDLYEAGFTEREVADFVKSEYGLAVRKPAGSDARGVACVKDLKQGVLDIYRNEKLAKDIIKVDNAPQRDESEEGKNYVTIFGEHAEQAGKVTKETFDKATEDAKKEINDVYQASVFGYQSSTTGLLVRGKLPNMTMPEDAGIFDKVSFMAGQTIGDLPTIVGGGLAGSPAGPVGMATMAMATTEGTRAALMELYRKGEVTTFEEGVDVLTEGAKGFGKGALFGSLAALGGLGATKLATSAIASNSTKAAAKFMKAHPKSTTVAAGILGEEAGAVGAQVILEQKLPTLEDFAVSAIQIGGIHGGKFYINKLTNAFAKTGKTPKETIDNSLIDPKSRLNMVAMNTDIESAKPAWIKNQEKVFFTAEKLGEKDIFFKGQADKEKAVTIEKGKATEEGREERTLNEYRLKKAEENNFINLDDSTVFETIMAYIDDLDSSGELAGKADLLSRLSHFMTEYYNPNRDVKDKVKAREKLTQIGYELFEQADDHFLWFVKTSPDLAYKAGLIEGGDPRLTTAQRIKEGQAKPGAKAEGEVSKEVQVVLDKVQANNNIRAKQADVYFKYDEILREAEEAAAIANDYSEYNRLEELMKQELAEAGSVKELTERQNEIYNKYLEGQALEKKNARLKDQAEHFRTLKYQEYLQKTKGPAGYVLPNGRAVILRTEAIELVDAKKDMKKRIKAVAEEEKKAGALTEDEVQEVLAGFGKSIIRPEDKSFRQKLKENLPKALTDLQTHFVDRLAVLDKGSAKGQVTQSYFQGSLFSGVSEYINHIMLTERVAFGTRKVLPGRPIVDLLKQVDDMEELSKYILAIKTKEGHILGTDTKESLNDALAILNNNELKDKYDPVIRGLKDHMLYLAEYSKDAGLLSKAKYEKLKKSKLSLLPLGTDKNELRLIVDEAILSDEPILKALGLRSETREQIYNDPVQSIVMNTVATILAAEKNAVKRIIARQYGKDTAHTPDAELKAVYKELGVESEKDITISFKENGETKTFLVPEAIAKTTYNLEFKTLEMHNAVLRAMGKLASVTRAGAVLNIPFMIANFFRDQFTAGLQSQYGYVPFVDWARGFMAHMNYVSGGKVFKDYDGVMNRWLRNNGKAGSLLFDNRDRALDIIRHLQKPSAKNVIEDPVKHYKEIMRLVMPYNWAKLALNGLRFGAEASELGTRLGEFMKAEQAGLSPSEAAFDARRVTIDFQRAGTTAQALNAMIPFFNAGIQGTARLVETFKDRPLETTSALIGGLVVPTLLLGLVNADIQINDPDSEMAKQLSSVPTWERAAYWFIPAGELMLKIPKPHGYNIFTQAVEMWCEAAVQEDKNLFYNMHRTGLLESFSNIVGVGLLPAAFKAPIENVANYSFFTGTPLVPAYLENQLPEMQYKVATTETAKFIGRVLGQIGTDRGLNVVQRMGNPILIENLVRGWSGTLGMEILKAVDMAGEAVGFYDTNKPTKSLAELPLLSSFLYKYEKYGAYQITEFSDRAKEFEQRYNTTKALLSSQNPSDRARGEELLQRYPFVEFDSLLRARGEISMAITGIYNDKNMNPDEKADLINELYVEMMILSQAGLDIMNQIEKAWEEQ